MKSSNNRGMLLETIINKTVEYYNKNNIALIHKKTLDIKFSAIDEMRRVKNGVVVSKSTVDYYGIYKGSFIAFEAKSSNTNVIPKNNFKEHQHDYLLKIKKYNGNAFYIFLFKQTNEVFLAEIGLINYRKKTITLEYLRNKAISLEIIYPGIIDFVKYL
ncbi:MAG: Holliday junction resolvase RecU [Metamycoplasmataceae bacterium]